MRTGLLPTLVPLLIAAAMGGLIAWLLIPEPAPRYNRVEVPVEVIREVERVDTVVTWKERIVYRTVQPTTVAVADSGGVGDLEAFCGPLVAEATEEALASANATDAPMAAPARPDPVLLLRSVRVEDRGLLRRDRAILTGPRSDGSLWQGTYSVAGSWQGAARGPEMLVQTPRAWWLRDLLTATALFGGGYLIGSL